MKNSTLSELLYFCRSESCVGALLLTGDWGCGKTYLIEKVLKEKLKEEEPEGIVIRASLFGLTSVSEVHNAVRKAYMDAVLKDKGLNQPAGVVSRWKNKLSGLSSALEDVVPKPFTKIASLDVSSFFEIEDTMDGKRTILVFDDLERCRADIVDVLGVINDYCENKGIRTIIVANQEKIDKKSNHQEIENANEDEDKCGSNSIKGNLSYSEIKEKIIQRTIYYEPSEEDIINCVISALEGMPNDYKEFVTGCRYNLVTLMSGENASRNLRSLKCAVNDYYRVYEVLKSAGVAEQRPWFLNFVSFLMAAKDGIVAGEQYETLLMDGKAGDMYPEYQNGYVLEGVKYWILRGEWDEALITEEIAMRMDREKGLSPAELIRLNLLQDLDEEIIESGWSEFLGNIYQGNVNLDDYAQLVSNSCWCRQSGYNPPEPIDWNQVESGLQARIRRMESKIQEIGNEDKARERELIEGIRLEISADRKASFTDEEKRIYDMVHDFTEKGVLRYYMNRANYISLITSDPMAAFAICRNKRFDCFSVDMAEATGQAFKGLQNADKRAFVSEFRSMIQAIDLSREDHLRKSIEGYRRLKEMAEDLRSEYQQAEKGIAEWNTKSLIAAADDAIHKLEGNLGFAEKAQQKEKNVPDIKAKVEEKVSAKSDAVQDEKVAEIANTTQEKNTVSITDTLQDKSSVSDADTEKKGRKISYSVDEIDSIRYYQGDTSRFKSDYRRRDKKKLYAIGNAYEVLNTLLYPGISNEEARITIEKRKLSTMLLDNMEDVLMTYEHMISAIFKSSGPEGITKAYRFDRENSLQFLKQGKTCSFMSTTQAADLEYFKRKCGLVLEEIIAEPGTPCLNLNQMLSESGKYSHEKEILFPPFVKLEMREIELSEIERTYRDKENKPPIGKWVIHIVGCEEADEEIRDYDLSQTGLEKLQQQILDESETRNAKGIWKCLENNQKIEKEDKDKYIAWKEKIQEYVRILCIREWKQRGETL